MNHEEETRNFLGSPNDCERSDDDDYDWNDEGDDEEEQNFESMLRHCGYTSPGRCTLAGTEECDWHCPFGGP